VLTTLYIQSIRKGRCSSFEENPEMILVYGIMLLSVLPKVPLVWQ
jgi:hypothetical protein